MIEERLKVLKVMSEVTGRLDLNEFARMVGLNPNQTVEQMQELLKADFVRKVGGGYGITDAGRAMLKVFASVPDGMKFHFYVAIGYPTSFSAKSLFEFYEVAKQIAAEALAFHMYRGDFENWASAALNDAAFAEELAELKKTQLKGEKLRKAILKATETQYGLDKLQ